jgi:cysteine desulfurase
MMRLYLDHNATTPLAAPVLAAVTDALRDGFGNASSVHHFGQRAKAALDTARGAVASLVGAEPAEIVFTSGGTEADNLAVRGIADLTGPAGRRHLVVSAIEHEAVLQTARALQRRGWEVTQVRCGSSGVIEAAEVAAAMRDDTALVSVMHANNEIGTIQPIAAIAAAAHARGVPVHTDAVQTAGKVPVSVRELDVDLLTLTAHKMQGPKGAGALFVRRGTKLTPLLTGGRQERNRRGGTENVPAIVGFGAAAQLAAATMATEAPRQAALRDRFEAAVLARVPGCTVNGAPDRRVPNTSNISFDGVEAEALLIALDLEGIAVSTGAACSSGTLEPSHVLRAMGLPPARVQSAIRFSLGATTTDGDIDRVLDVLPPIVARLRTLR